MSSVKAVNKTKIDSGVLVERGLHHGKLRVMYDEYTAAALESGSDISMFDKLPLGARVIDVEVFAAALGSSVTVKAGDGENDDCYISATTMNTANLRTRINVPEGVGRVVDAENKRQIKLTTGGAVATGLIRGWVYFLVD